MRYFSRQWDTDKKFFRDLHRSITDFTVLDLNARSWYITYRLHVEDDKEAEMHTFVVERISEEDTVDYLQSTIDDKSFKQNIGGPKTEITIQMVARFVGQCLAQLINRQTGRPADVVTIFDQTKEKDLNKLEILNKLSNVVGYANGKPLYVVRQKGELTHITIHTSKVKLDTILFRREEDKLIVRHNMFPYYFSCIDRKLQPIDYLRYVYLCIRYATQGAGCTWKTESGATLPRSL